jgi:hypothetical protein
VNLLLGQWYFVAARLQPRDHFVATYVNPSSLGQQRRLVELIYIWYGGFWQVVDLISPCYPLSSSLWSAYLNGLLWRWSRVSATSQQVHQPFQRRNRRAYINSGTLCTQVVVCESLRQGQTFLHPPTSSQCCIDLLLKGLTHQPNTPPCRYTFKRISPVTNYALWNISWQDTFSVAPDHTVWLSVDQRGMYQTQWEIILDDEFLEAVVHGILIDCCDGV